MKPKFLYCLALLSLSHSAVSTDIGLSWSASELNQPIEIGPSQDTLSAINHSVQLNYSTQDWLFGAAISRASSDDNSNVQRIDSDANLRFDSHELYANYYQGNWQFSVALGQSDIAHRVIKIRHLGSNRQNYVDRRDLQEYDNKDKFYELSTRYYLDLSEQITDLSIDFEVTATRFQTRGDQMNQSEHIQVSNDPQARRFIAENDIRLGLVNAGRHEIDESLWIYSFASNLDYSFTLLNKDWLASLWYEREMSSQSDGSFTVSRLRNNNRVIRQEFPLSESGEQSNLDDLNSYGIDLTLALSDSLSSHVSWLDSDLGQGQFQIGLSYWF